MVWGTFFFRNEVPQSARLSAGGGGGSYLGNAQIVSHIFGGAFPNMGKMRPFV